MTMALNLGAGEEGQPNYGYVHMIEQRYGARHNYIPRG